MSCKVSVIIPVYNCIKYLDKAVASVISQTEFDSLELILVDDGSSDGSEKLCDAYAKKYKNIFALHQDNSGVSVARNTGLDAAKGEYIAFLDSDDEYKPSFVFEMLQAADADLVCCDYFVENDEEKNLGAIFKSGFYKKESFDLSFFLNIISEQFYSCWDKLYKNEIIKNNKLKFMPGVKYGEDMIFVFEYLKHCDSFRYTDKRLYHYNINPNNATCVVKNGFDVRHFIYEYQVDYFKGTPFEKEITDAVSDRFVFLTTNTVNSEITYENFFAAYRYVKRVLSSDFYGLYLKANYTEFKCTYDRVYFTLLKKRMALAVVLWRKLFDLRSRLFHD